MTSTMTTNEQRATTLVKVLRASIERDRPMLQALLTDDVRTWTPALSTASLTELLGALDDREDVFSEIELDVAALDVSGDYACVEWTARMTHTGTITLIDRSIEPSGIRAAVHGVTIAEFLGDRICSLRQYWDELALFEQLGVRQEAGSP